MFLLLLATIWTAQAATLPEWVDRPPRPDLKYRYYVGRATGETSERQAFHVATQDAVENAIRENFGVTTSINSTDLETSHYVALDKRTDETSPRVRLEDFEQIDSHLVREEGGINVYLLFRYSLTAIAAEKQRLATGLDVPGAPLSEAGTVGTGTELVIQSEPAGADVFIDGARWGVTPVAIRGALAPGEHTLSLRHTKFEDVNETIVLQSNFLKNVRKILRPATGTLHITSSPKKAEIVVDGIRRGIAPLTLRHVPVGKEIVVQAKFNAHDTLSRTLEIEKGEDRDVAIELPEQKPVEEPVEEHVRREPAAEDDDGHASAWLFGLGMEFGGANIPRPYGQSIFGFDLTIERRFWSRFGLRLKGGYDVGTGSSQSSNNQESTSGSSTLSGLSYGVGLPFYLSSRADAIYVMPEFGGINYLYPQSGTPNGIEFDYTRVGGAIGYQDQSSKIKYNVYLSVYRYDWHSLGQHTAATVGVALVFGK